MPTKDFEWFTTADLSDYVGEYVVILDQKVISHGPDAQIAYKEALEKYPNTKPTLAKVPTEDILIL